MMTRADSDTGYMDAEPGIREAENEEIKVRE
jgi:hypothetical protein